MNCSAPAGLSNYHFGAEFVKLVPQFFQLKMALDTSEIVARRMWCDVTVGS